MQKNFNKIALVKEIESPENPGSLEKRVALIPQDVGRLVTSGADVFVEKDAGKYMGFLDAEYQSYGAVIESEERIYRNKDLIIKFKNVALSTIPQILPQSTLFCMAHFHSYPARAELLRQQKINVVAMEEIRQSPKAEEDIVILGRVAMNTFLQPHVNNNNVSDMNVYIFQWTERLRGAVRCASNHYPKSLHIIQDDATLEELLSTDNNSLIFYDAKALPPNQNVLLHQLKKKGAHLFNLTSFEKAEGKQMILAYRQFHKPLLLGGRRIQCLHETGQAGARYGLMLLAKKSKKTSDNVTAVILGCGNVAQGAIHELYQKGVRKIQILGRHHTSQGKIEKWLKDADLIINGVDQAEALRGKIYLITNLHLKSIIKKGAVIIDLVGGSKDNRSPIEPVINCTFLTNPYFIQNNVIVSALWGWPMMGMEKETTLRYSAQIVDVLLGEERLIDGFNDRKNGLARALVCGPFNK